MMHIIGNFDQVATAFLIMVPRLEEGGLAAQKTGAEAAATIATRLAPVLTGELKASIGIDGAEVVATSDHAIYQEYGTRTMKAQPFMGPARDAAEPIMQAAAEVIFTVATR
jgi:HK97 gp10 family phage protein